VLLSAGQPQIEACSNESTVISARVLDRVGNPVADDTTVAWSSTAGQLIADQTATREGLTQSELVAGRLAAAATVSAQAGDAIGSIDVDIVPGPPRSIALSADPIIVRRGGSSTITANVLDGCANYVADGWQIELVAERGSFGDSGRRRIMQTAGGSVRAELAVGGEPGSLRVVAFHEDVIGQVYISVQERAMHELYLPFAYTPGPRKR
jgi:hypothetical protein